MKKFDPDLTILDHADEATLMMLSETPLAGESERKKILEKSIRKYEQRVGALPGGVSSDSVEGVESYRRPKWHITMSSLAAVVSLGIGFAAISHIMRSPSPVPPQDPLISTEATDTTHTNETVTALVPGTGTLPAAAETGTLPAEETAQNSTGTGSADTAISSSASDGTAAAAASADTTVTPAPGLYAVELHSDDYPFYTQEQILDIIRAGNADYAANGPRLIDRSIYISMIHDAKDTAALNTPEIKSYIYHMMLNTTDYFTSASGKISYTLRNESSNEDIVHNETAFMTDLSRDLSKYMTAGIGFNDYVFSADNTEYMITDNLYNGFTVITAQALPDPSVRMDDFRYNGGSPLIDEVHNISTNDRYFFTPDPSVNSLRNYNGRILNNLYTSTGMGETCLEPGTEAIDHLPWFQEWQITGTTTVAGRECAVLQSAYGSSWTMCVDIEYGFLMKYVERYDYGDTVEASTQEVTSLSIGGDYFIASSAEYGTAEDSNSVYGLPAYIFVTNRDGISGYIRRDDLLAVPPLTSQADALSGSKTVNLNIYSRETGAVIGTITANSTDDQ